MDFTDKRYNFEEGEHQGKKSNFYPVLEKSGKENVQAMSKVRSII